MNDNLEKCIVAVKFAKLGGNAKIAGAKIGWVAT